MTTTVTDGITIITPLMVLGWKSERQAGTVVHAVIGSPDVSATLRPAGSRQGTLGFLFDNLAQALALEAMLSLPSVFQLIETSAPALGMRFVATGAIGVSLEEDTRQCWITSCQFRQVP